MNIKELLKKKDSEIIEHITGLKSKNEQVKILKEMIEYLEENKSLLDKERFKPGKRLIEKLRELEIKNEDMPTRIKKNEYSTNEMIWWKGTEPMIIYLFELLFSSNLIDDTQYENRWAFIEKHFKNKFGNNYKNTQLATTYDRLREDGIFKKPIEKDAETIEDIVKTLRRTIKELK